MKLTGRIAVQNFKRSVAAAFAALCVTSTAVHAMQIVEPRLTVGGLTIANSTQSVPAGSTFTFYGFYSDDSGVTATNTTGAESGLGLKVKYNGLHLTNVSITEQYTKCRIAAAQYPASNSPATTPSATDQAVMGWIDTAVRPTGAAASANGSVGWPDLIDQASTGQCLNPGNINSDTAAVAPSELKLFKFTATMAPGCTSPGACTSTVTFDSEGNYSYASGSPGMATKTFSIAGAAAPTIALLGGGSRKVHTGVGDQDITVTSINAAASIAAASLNNTISVEPRLAGAVPGAFTGVMTFNQAVTSFGGASVISCLQWNGTAAVTCVTTPTFGTPVVSASNTSEVVIPITGVADQTRLQIRLANVNGGINADMTIGFLAGDINGNGFVQGTDVAIVKGRVASAAAVTVSNFKSDINSNGFFQGSDTSAVSTRVGRQLP